ncbi:uncharacterized protein B0I36DRAFT_332147, partial [Microdochium trichocladiopsis]
MRSLMAFHIRNDSDAALYHTLGGMLAYSIYSTVGLGFARLTHFCLASTSSFAPCSEDGSQEGHVTDMSVAATGQSFLVMLEIMDCLINRTQPTPLRVPRSPSPSATPSSKPALAVLDSHLGLCVPLLPYYHDLCVINNSLLHTQDEDHVRALHDRLTEIHRSVESWQPPSLAQLLDHPQHPKHSALSTVQVIHLLSQARLYRLGVMLMAHRLRHPFGDTHHDHIAGIWSREIMTELESAYTATQQPLRFVTLPFIIAAVEATGVDCHHQSGPNCAQGKQSSPRERTLRALDEHVDRYAPALKTAIKQFLSKIWQERDADPGLRWFDSVHKPCPVVDSIYADLCVPVAVT